jgi:hypothetical protein
MKTKQTGANEMEKSINVIDTEPSMQVKRP